MDFSNSPLVEVYSDDLIVKYMKGNSADGKWAIHLQGCSTRRGTPCDHLDCPNLEIKFLTMSTLTQSKQGRGGKNKGYNNSRSGVVQMVTTTPNRRRTYNFEVCFEVIAGNQLYWETFGSKSPFLVRALQEIPIDQNEPRDAFRHASSESGLLWRLSLKAPSGSLPSDLHWLPPRIVGDAATSCLDFVDPSTNQRIPFITQFGSLSREGRRRPHVAGRRRSREDFEDLGDLDDGLDVPSGDDRSPKLHRTLDNERFAPAVQQPFILRPAPEHDPLPGHRLDPFSDEDGLSDDFDSDRIPSRLNRGPIAIATNVGELDLLQPSLCFSSFGLLSPSGIRSEEDSEDSFSTDSGFTSPDSGSSSPYFHEDSDSDLSQDVGRLDSAWDNFPWFGQ